MEAEERTKSLDAHGAIIIRWELTSNTKVTEKTNGSFGTTTLFSLVLFSFVLFALLSVVWLLADQICQHLTRLGNSLGFVTITLRKHQPTPHHKKT